MLCKACGGCETRGVHAAQHTFALRTGRRLTREAHAGPPRAVELVQAHVHVAEVGLLALEHVGAVIAWTAPAAYKAEAGPFVERALNRHFNGKPWNFTHTDMKLRSKPWSGGSQVVDRHRKDPLRMPSSMYTKGAPARHRV